MKKIWYFLLVFSTVAIGFSSCSDNSDDKWRDKNLEFIDKIKDQADVHEIGDSINGYPGIYYQILKEGTGAKPVIKNKVNVSYAGWLINDTIQYTKSKVLDTDEAFDSSSDYDFTVGTGVIDGWSLAIQYMPVGAKWRIFVPYYLGYGSSAQSSIPAYSTLIFDIYLREIVSEK